MGHAGECGHSQRCSTTLSEMLAEEVFVKTIVPPAGHLSLHTRLRSIAKEILALTPETETYGQSKAHPKLIIDRVSLPRALVNERRERAKFLSGDIFGEPSWDILLDLYIADSEGRDISVSSACIAANVPDSTAQRCLHHLVEDGLVRRTNDPYDQRRVFVTLADETKTQMHAYFQTIAQSRSSENA
jgi:DNA-binding MarR family transcriptional regulator